MADLIVEFLVVLLNDAFSAIDGVLVDILDNMLRVERMLGGLVNSSSIIEAYNFIYSTAVSLVLLKFLFKGFQIYILWRDGDADSSPQEMVMGTVQAAVVMVGFPTLYNMMADVTLWFAQGIMGSLNVSSTTLSSLDHLFFSAVSAPLVVILAVVYVILAIVLWVKLLKLGLDLLVLRLGVPIACVGLVDSDGGVFKTYIQTLFRTLFTAVIQIVMFALSVRLLISGVTDVMSILFSIAAVSAAFSAPVLMQQLLVPTRGGGGGVMNKIYTGSMVARGIRGLLGR